MFSYTAEVLGHGPQRKCGVIVPPRLSFEGRCDFTGHYTFNSRAKSLHLSVVPGKNSDDVCLLAHGSIDLQELVHILERGANDVGLRLNMGQGKTERFCIGDSPGEVFTLNGTPIPLVAAYKYLGSMSVLNFQKEFKQRKGYAWAVVNAFASIWDSDVRIECKRRLFRSLVDPIFTYGAHAWPMNKTRENALDDCYGRLLRRAMGLPPAYLSHTLVHTEELYGDIPFVSSVIAERRFKICAHVYRSTLLFTQGRSGGTPHALSYVLDFDTTHLSKHRGERSTFISSLEKSARLPFDSLHSAFADRKRSFQIATEIRAERQSERYRSIYMRRARAMMAYFETAKERRETGAARKCLAIPPYTVSYRFLVSESFLCRNRMGELRKNMVENGGGCIV